MHGKFTVNECSHGNNHWRVEGRIDGRRIRAFYRTKLEAQEAARLRNIEVANHGHKHADIPSGLRVEALLAQRRLGPIGATLTQAVDFYLKHHDMRAASVTVSEAFKRLKEDSARKVAGEEIKKRHAETQAINVGKFVRDFSEHYICDISSHQINEWLNRLPVATATKNTIRRYVSGLFYYADKCGWLSSNPMPKVTSFTERNVKLPGILSVSQAAKLLETAPGHLVPPIAIGLFAGIRPGEVQRLDWKDILWDKRLINVSAANSKTAQPRWVDMPDCLVEWLSPHAKPSGRIFPFSEACACAAITAAYKATGEKAWPRNALRHSFGSYHLAAHANSALTAHQMGHMTTKMVFAHYNNRRTKEEGLAFFKIRPAWQLENIVAIA
jgi:integrase